MSVSPPLLTACFAWALLASAFSGCAPEDGPTDGDPADVGIDAGSDAELGRVDAAIDRALKFAFPIHPDDRHHIHPTLIFGVDHDPARGTRSQCLNYDDQPFPLCYDGHDGSDFILADGFAQMDRESARVVAAAAGEVYGVTEDNYDRCHGDWSTGDISCDGNPVRANYVRVRHANGWVSWYYHLKRDTVVVEIGDAVDCGDVLGLVGSSGRSYLPHLHFEVADSAGVTVDPFGGALTGEVSHWMEQEGPDRLPGPACHPLWQTP